MFDQHIASLMVVDLKQSPDAFPSEPGHRFLTHEAQAQKPEYFGTPQVTIQPGRRLEVPAGGGNLCECLDPVAVVRIETRNALGGQLLGAEALAQLLRESIHRENIRRPPRQHGHEHGGRGDQPPQRLVVDVVGQPWGPRRHGDGDHEVLQAGEPIEKHHALLPRRRLQITEAADRRQRPLEVAGTQVRRDALQADDVLKALDAFPATLGQSDGVVERALFQKLHGVFEEVADLKANDVSGSSDVHRQMWRHRAELGVRRVCATHHLHLSGVEHVATKAAKCKRCASAGWIGSQDGQALGTGRNESAHDA
mmetsp:Transcript_58384/g.190428  ORF Transcript_58384/g.190428 Transcript_58384/m.190428 type:complete len:310 (+) Transcript_58384:1293-2222(+)